MLSNKYKMNKDSLMWVIRPLGQLTPIDMGQSVPKPWVNRPNTKEITKERKKEDASLQEDLKSKEFLAHYFDRYKKRIGDKLPVHSERIILPKIEATAELFGGYEKLKELLEIYFDKDDKFYKENKWTLTCFLSENILNKLND